MLVILDFITRKLSLRRLPPGPGCNVPMLPSRNVDKESSIEGLDILKLTSLSTLVFTTLFSRLNTI